MSVLTLLIASLGLVGPMTSSAQASSAECHTKTKGDVQTTTCVQVTKIYGRKFQVAYRDGLINHGKKTAELSCTASTSKTWTFKVSASVKAEAGAIFAKVSGEVSGGVEHSSTTGYVTSAKEDVPAGQTLFCDRGVYTYKFKGKVTKVVCSNANCSTGTQYFSGTAPKRPVWLLSVGH